MFFKRGGILATGGSKRCIAVSTLAEAEFYADAGFEETGKKVVGWKVYFYCSWVFKLVDFYCSWVFKLVDFYCSWMFKLAMFLIF